MRILIDNGTYELLNLGDVAMLQVAVNRFKAIWPDSHISVVTNYPDRLATFCPGTHPLAAAGRDQWVWKTDLGKPLYRRLPALKKRLQSVETGLRQKFPTALLKLAERRLTGRGEDAAPVRDFIKTLLASDLVVCSGGGYLTDAFAEHAMNVVETLGLAATNGVPTAMLGQGLGPVTQSRLEVPMRRTLPKIDTLCLRETRASKPLALELGARPDRIRVTGDDAVQLAYDVRPDGFGTRLGINLRTAWYAAVPETAIPALRQAIAGLSTAFDADLLPLPVSLHKDGEDERAILRMVGDAAPLAADDGGVHSPADLIRRVGTCRLVITGSYHAGVFALAQGIPVIGLAQSDYYQAKFAGLAEQFGPACVSVRLDGPDLARNLLDEGTRLWNDAPALRGPLLAAAETQVKAGLAAFDSLRSLAKR